MGRKRHSLGAGTVDRATATSGVKVALKAAERIEKKYGKNNLGLYSKFDWGMINGKLSAPHWVFWEDWARTIYLNGVMDMKSQPEPDEIEQKIIATLSSILQEDTLWADNRSYLKRIIEKGKSGSDTSDKNVINENEEVWTKTIVDRLSALGRRLRFTTDGRQRDWMYDVLWRDQNTAGDWGTTESIPLVLCCDWYMGGRGGYPLFEPLDKLMIARAEHRVLICQHKYSGNVFDRFTS